MALESVHFSPSMYKHQVRGVGYSREVSFISFFLNKLTTPDKPGSVHSLQFFSRPCCGHSPCSLPPLPQVTSEILESN